MSDYEKVAELPAVVRKGGRGPHPVWETARSTPGQWYRTGFAWQGASQLRKLRPDWEIAVRQGVVYIRFPAPATNGRKKR